MILGRRPREGRRRVVVRRTGSCCSQHQITSRSASTASPPSVLPVWMLLTPRDYLSTFMKIGTIVFLVLGVIIVNPKLQAPAFSEFVGGGGPIIPGPLFPFVFITIACGAISGFHALIATGHDAEDGRQGKRHPADRLRRDALRGARRRHGAHRRHGAPSWRLLRHQHARRRSSARSGMSTVNLPDLQQQVGEIVVGRTGRRGLAGRRHGADLQRAARACAA